MTTSGQPGLTLDEIYTQAKTLAGDIETEILEHMAAFESWSAAFLTDLQPFIRDDEVVDAEIVDEDDG